MWVRVYGRGILPGSIERPMGGRRHNKGWLGCRRWVRNTMIRSVYPTPPLASASSHCEASA
eukprot:760593-Hanusia_phi.AAC.9